MKVALNIAPLSECVTRGMTQNWINASISFSVGSSDENHSER